MKTKRKALLLTLCAVLLVAASVFGTIAYLTDTEAVTNTFTVGQITMSMDEAKVNTDGTVVEGGDRVLENTYHLLPGHTYSKDPVVHLTANSSCYVFIKVDNKGIEAIEEKDTSYVSVANQILNNGWTWWKNDSNVHYFYKLVENNTNQEVESDLPVFSSFKVDESVTNEGLKTFYEGAGTEKAVTVTAYAIQKDGFDSHEAAWTAGGWQ